MTVPSRSQRTSRIIATASEQSAALTSMLVPLAIMRSVRDSQGAVVDFEWTFINEAGAAAILLPLEGLVGSRLLERLPEHRNGLFAEYVRVVETGRPFNADHVGYDDTWGSQEVLPRVFNIRAVKVSDGFAVSWSDVTDQIAAEHALAASAQLFRRAMADSGIGMALVDLDGSLLEVNGALCAFFGYDAATLRSMTWRELTHPDDLQSDLVQLRQMVRGEIDTYRLRKRFRRADGAEVVGDLTVSAIRRPDRSLSRYVSQILDPPEGAGA